MEKFVWIVSQYHNGSDLVDPFTEYVHVCATEKIAEKYADTLAKQIAEEYSDYDNEGTGYYSDDTGYFETGIIVSKVAVSNQ